MPSLEGSLREFLDGKHWARALAGPDTGWSAVFRQLSRPVKFHASFSLTRKLVSEELTADDRDAISEPLELGESDLAPAVVHAAAAIQIE